MKKYIYILCLTFIFASCGNYLDKMPEADGYDFDKVFKDSVNYRNFCEYLVINPFFLYHENGVKPYGSYDCLTDNSISTALFSGVPSVQAQLGNYYALRTNGDAPMSNNGTWEQIWKHLRVANTGIRNIDFYSGGSVSRDKILGMCYFYRAFCYMDLTRRWGGMPYLYAPITNASEDMDYPRLSMQETYKRAAVDCDSAAMYLKNTIPNSEFQHPTRVAALALKSRILLYAASDLARYENGTGEDLWEEAALAADEAIRVMEEAGHGLVDWDDYYYIFKGDNESIYTKEVLFGRRANHQWGSDAYTNTARPPGQLSGKYGVAVNQLLVDCFEMQATGLPVDDPESQYKEQNPYAGRDPRFGYNVIYNGQQVMNRTMEIYQTDESKPGIEGSKDLSMSGGVPLMGFTQTGYYAKKWLGMTFNAHLPLLWPYIRTAEIYMGYAEAANEAWSAPSSLHSGCLYTPEQAINKVRNRAQMPGIHSKFLTKDKFRERVRNERRIELCFEEHRIFDLRRWKIGTQPENRDIWRMYITKLAPGYNASVYPTGYKFEKQFYMRRIYEDRHNLFVIKLDDTNIGPNFKQNPGW